MKRLKVEQLERKIKPFNALKDIQPPSSGWLKAVRSSLGMSLRQLANKLDITKQSAMELEIREKEGRITINSLREAAKALDMVLIYGLVPKDGSIENLIDRKAKDLAKKIVNRTSNTMKLEDQEITKQRFENAIEERTQLIKKELPKILWD